MHILCTSCGRRGDALRDGQRARCSKAAVDAVHALEQTLAVRLLSRTRRLACRQRTDSVLPTAAQGVEERRAAMQAQAELHAAAAKKLAIVAEGGGHRRALSATFFKF